MPKTHIIVLLAAFSCGAAFAQQSTPTSSATYPSAAGDVSVKTAQPAAKSFGAPPDFTQLQHGNGGISAADAEAYPPLANDFIHADLNRDGRVSKSEYARWSAAR